MELLPVEFELFHVDGQTDTQTSIKKLIDAFRNVANAPKKGPVIWCKHL